MNEFIVDINQQNAQQYLIEESFNRPVMIDFWADWCEPCKTLMPLLEKLAQEYGGKFLLARVNADELQPIAAQLGVQSLPTVMLMKDGQPLDGFVGAQPETEIRALLEKHLPALWQGLVDQAQELIAGEDYQSAMPLLREAYQESGEKPSVGTVLAQVLIQLNRCDEAEAILEKIPYIEQDASYEQAMAQLELKREAADSPEVLALQKSHESDPENLDIAYKLAVQYSQNHKTREALELLLDILRKDINFLDGDAKKTLMDILAALGKGDPLAVEFQRKFYTLMY